MRGFIFLFQFLWMCTFERQYKSNGLRVNRLKTIVRWWWDIKSIDIKWTCWRKSLSCFKLKVKVSFYRGHNDKAFWDIYVSSASFTFRIDIFRRVSQIMVNQPCLRLDLSFWLKPCFRCWAVKTEFFASLPHLFDSFLVLAYHLSLEPKGWIAEIPTRNTYTTSALLSLYQNQY